MPDPKIITEDTTLAELREQRLLLGVIGLRLYPSSSGADKTVVAASVHHASGFYDGAGSTEASAIEAAFVKLRRALLPEPLKQYLQEIEDDSEENKP